jgi:hypothetical protein
VHACAHLCQGTGKVLDKFDFPLQDNEILRIATCCPQEIEAVLFRLKEQISSMNSSPLSIKQSACKTICATE